MNSGTIRQQLQNYLEIADDQKIKAIYTLMENEIKNANIEYSDELRESLDNQYVSYKYDPEEKMVSFIESKKRINKILGK